MKRFDFEKKNEDGSIFDIRVLLIDGKFRVDDVGIKEKRKRNYTYIIGKLHDDYMYRRLNTEGRNKAELDLIIKTIGIDTVNEVLLSAWKSIKPEEIK